MPRLMAMLDTLNAQLGDIEFVFGLAQNKVLMGKAAAQAALAAAEHGRTKEPVKLYSEFEYAAGSWLMDRRVVLKAEQMPRAATRALSSPRCARGRPRTSTSGTATEARPRTTSRT
jgi:hypothetical protein